MNKNILGLIAIVIAAVIAFMLLSGGSDTTEQSSQTQSAEQSEQSDQTTSSYTASEIAEHATEEDCWTIVDGLVYDITSYIPRHPGGDTILLACGADGTSLFQDRTTNDGETVGSGTSHSSGAANALSELQIGELGS